MKKILTRLSILVVVALCSITTFSQANVQFERKILTHLKNLEKLASKTAANRDKALAKENAALEREFRVYGQTASTLKYGFKALANKMFIATSKDGKFRIYSWDTQTGGTMRDFENVFQYMGDKGKVYVQAIPQSKKGGVRGFSHQVFQFDTGSRRIYLANFTFVFSTSAIRQELSVYGIDGRKLNSNLKLINTRSGPHNSVGFDYDFFSVVNRPERPVTLFHFDDAMRSFRFPVVLDDKKFVNGGRVTDKFITYRFNGKYFVRVK